MICSFCKRPLEKVNIMIASAVEPDQAICGECVEGVTAVLEASDEADELEIEVELEPPGPKLVQLADIIARRAELS